MSGAALLTTFGLTRAAGDSPNPGGGFTHYRLLFTENEGNPYWATTVEFEIRDELDGPSLPLTKPGTPFASSASAPAANAFDGSYSTGWDGGSASGLTLPQWLGFQFDDPVTAVQFAIGGHSQYRASAAIKSGAIQGSNDGVAWTTILELVNEPAWGRGEKRVFTP